MSDDPVRNKIAIVTGGTRGIGRAITEHLLDAGASVAICGRTQSTVDSALRELGPRGRVIGMAADVTSEPIVSNFFQFVDREFGGVDILINNAGLGIFRSVADLTPQEWRSTLDTNLSGVFYCCHAALSRFRRRSGGYIINISSLAGRNPFAGGSAYNATKFGLNGFSEALMLDHLQEGVRVSSVMPGSVATGFGSGSSANWKIAPEDIASIVMMLLRTPERTLISRVEVRPSKPPK
jgi:NAD(P)-dependent dehydrogenase (short-subunit alcohol dehydrogenase family)